MSKSMGQTSELQEMKSRSLSVHGCKESFPILSLLADGISIILIAQSAHSWIAFSVTATISRLCSLHLMEQIPPIDSVYAYGEVKSSFICP